MIHLTFKHLCKKYFAFQSKYKSAKRPNEFRKSGKLFPDILLQATCRPSLRHVYSFAWKCNSGCEDVLNYITGYIHLF
jgi:hypothetical protein